MKTNTLIKLLLAGFLSLNLTGCALGNGAEEYEKGVQAYEQEDYSTAASFFEAALDQNSDRAEYHLYYGFALLELGEYSAATEQFEQVIQDKDITMIQENNKQAYRGAGIAHVYAQEPEQALTCFYAALQIEELPELDEDIRAYMDQANTSRLAVYREEGRLLEAQLLCEELQTTYGSSAELDFMLADILMEQEQYEQAEGILMPLYEAGMQEAGYYLAQIALNEAQYETAVTYLTQQLDRQENKADLYYQLAVCELKLSHIEEAVRYYEQLIATGDVSYAAKQEKLYIALLEVQGQWEEAYERLQQYMENNTAEQDEEFLELTRELQFLKTRQ